MNSELRDELLHLIAHERGEPTKKLYGAIEVLRMNKLWPFVEPVDEPGLQLLLFWLADHGHIENVPGRHWLVTSQVPRETARRTFEAEKQGELAF